MVEKRISGASIEDAERAVIEEFGNYQAKEVYRDSGKLERLVKLSSKIMAKCTITAVDGGVVIQLKNHWGQIQIVALVIGYCLCILPGLFMQTYLAIGSLIANRIIPGRLDKIALRTVQLANREVSTPRSDFSPPDNAHSA